MPQPRAHFGSTLRDRRLAKGYSLRKFAELVGVSPTYLSLIERGEAESPPTAERVRCMAELLGENPDQWIALAGRMPEDVADIIKKQPEGMPALLRAARGLTADQLKQLVAEIERKRDKEEHE